MDRKQGYADPDGPAATSTIQGVADTIYTLPPASLTVLRGKIAAANGVSNGPAPGATLLPLPFPFNNGDVAIDG